MPRNRAACRLAEPRRIETHGHAVEVSPLFALDADELAAKIPPGA